MAAPTLDGVSLKGCENVSFDKTGNLVVLPILTQDSDQNELFDLLGVTKTMSVSGRVEVGSEATAIRNKLEALANGDQSAVVTFSMTLINGDTFTLTGMVAQFGISWDIPGSMMVYDFKMFEGTI